MSATTATKASRHAKAANAITVLDTLIIGAGFAGLGSAIRLKQAGITNIAILERGSAVGGTWRDNQYPGAACDIPSNLYSYSFALNPGWSRGYSGAREILGYIHHLVAEYQLEELIRFQQNVTSMAFDERAGLWRIETAHGERHLARAVVMAQGPLSNASFPAMPGIEQFKGHKIHSARWDHGYDFADKKVAVIGTGASGIQIIPELVKVAEKVTVFQRTPGWVLPRADFAQPRWLQSLFAKAPRTQKAVRAALYGIHEATATAMIWNTPATRLAEAAARAHLKRQVPDRWMRRQLTPDFTIGCKRVLISNDYYPSLQAPNAKLITWPIATLSEKGIRTVEGVEHQVDCIVFATGFDVCKSGTPFPVTGLDGRQLGEEWSRGAQAFKSINVSGYPNLFLTFGPNSGPGHNSALVYMESQIDYAVQGITALLRSGHRYLDVKPAVQARHNTALQKRLTKTNWNSGCKSWYLTADGYNATMWPGFATQYAQQLKQFDLADYRAG